MRKEAQCGKEMWWGGYDPTVQAENGPSSFLCLLSSVDLAPLVCHLSGEAVPTHMSHWPYEASSWQ